MPDLPKTTTAPRPTHTTLSTKDQLDLAQKCWIEYCARRRHHHTLQVTLAGITGSLAAALSVAVKNYPAILGVADGNYEPGSIISFLVLAAAIVCVGLASSSEYRKADRYKVLAAELLEKMSAEPMFRVIADLEGQADPVTLLLDHGPTLLLPQTLPPAAPPIS